MVDRNKPLTYEQAQFAAEHHGIIYAFLNAYGLPESDYYDVVVFGYLNAVRKYTELPDLREYAFKTIAFWSMRTSLGNDGRKTARRIQAISLDAEDGDGLNLYGVVAAPEPEDTGGQFTAQYIDLLKALTKQQLNILTLKASGFTAGEIGEMLGMTARAVDSAVHRGRVKVQKAEQARSEQLKQKVDNRLGRVTTMEDFVEAEAVARRKLATYKTTHPTHRRKESALVKIAAELIAEPKPALCGGGVLIAACS